VLNEVESLRSLSVELYKSKLTMEEARQGHSIIKAFLKLGINPEKHLNLIEVCKKVEDPGFTEAALKLSQIETQTGVGYHQITSVFEKAQKQLPQLEEKIAEAKAELKSISDGVLKNKQEPAFNWLASSTLLLDLSASTYIRATYQIARWPHRNPPLL